MWSAFINVFRVPDIRKRLIFTLLMVFVYRVGSYIPVPGIDGRILAMFFDRLTQTQGGALFGMMNMFSGGAISRATIFALGIMPYISSSIILQLLTVVIPALEKMAREGDVGRKKLTQYTRYGTLVLAIIQSFFIALWLEHLTIDNMAIVPVKGWLFRIVTVITLASGTAFIMWLGEQITEKGIGNGMSLLITAGIISRIPVAMSQLFALVSPFDPARRQMSYLTVAVMAALGIGVIVAIVVITQGQRKIPVQYAKRMVGRRMYGGQSTYIPIRVNHAGVIPIIFAQSILLFPATIAGFVRNPLLQKIATALTRENALAYIIIYAGLIIFFAYFYTAITFNPIEIADNMKKYGGFIPGIRPGKSTSEFFSKILDRVTLPGAVFLAIIAVLPTLFASLFKVPYLIASFFGGTGLLIVVGVMLDTVRQLESQLVMRNYDGFLKHGRLKGRR